jgi:protein phosphatase inhibitor 2
MKWDEENLSDNAVIQKEVLANMGPRIDEPKTPYVNYVMPNEDTGDLTITDSHDEDHGFHLNDDEEPNEMLPSPREVSSTTISPQQQMDRLQDAFNSKNPQWDSDDEEMDDDEEDEPVLTQEQESKKKQFEEHRKQHYNEFLMMKKFKKQHVDDDDENT